MQEWYSGGQYSQKRMTRKQIQQMVQNMKKSKIISEKSNQYHKKEEDEAENILNDIGRK